MDDTRNVPEEIKERLPIDQLVGQYIPLKKAGRIYKALCPFHGEKTPSFTVNPDRGIYKCFGCGKGGDIFDFVMELEGLTFPEAIALLADKAGVTLPEFKRDPAAAAKPVGPNKARLFALNSYLSTIWHKVLMDHAKGAAALAYLEKRGVTRETMARFSIGYAPYGTGTGAGLSQQGFTRSEISAAGDPTKFQDRITFPIADLTGKVVGFTGRLLEMPDDPKGEASRGPKYWNTPETPIFTKSKTVYALHLAKHAIQKEGLTILAEGQMDVVALHQANYQNAVASSGTALTKEQLALIGRFAPAIAFAYDGDSAGVTATKRGLELALEVELTAYVIPMPKGKDPADLLQKEPTLWETAYSNRVPFIDWLIDQEVPHGTVLTPTLKREAATVLVDWLAKIHDVTERDTWMPFVAARLQTDEQNIRLLLKSRHPSLTSTQPRQERVEQPTRSTGTLADRALAILLTFPETYPVLKPQLQPLVATPTELGRHIGPILEKLSDTDTLEAALRRDLTDDERKELALQTETLLEPYNEIELTPSWAVTELSLILQRLRSESTAQAKQDIADAIGRAQALGDMVKVRELFQELQNLI